LESGFQHGLARTGFKIERGCRHNAILIRVGELRQSETGRESALPYKVQARTICTAATTDNIIATNHNGFFLVTVQIEAVAMATLKQEMASPILPPRRLASSRTFSRASAFALI
jgi:hypothetical protein